MSTINSNYIGNKSMKNVLTRLDKQEQIKEKFNTFLTTNNGKKFVSLLHREDIRVLANRLGCSYILFTPSIVKLNNFIDNIIEKANIKPEKPNVKIYTNIEVKKVKPFLSKEERRIINIRHARHHRFGKDAILHAYETHKINKWERKNPKPIKEDPFQKDLFENYFMQEWNNKREKALESIRDLLSKKYYKAKYFHIYHVFKDENGTMCRDLIQRIIDKEDEGKIVNYLRNNHRIIKLATTWADSLCLNDKFMYVQITNDDESLGRIVLNKRKYDIKYTPMRILPTGEIIPAKFERVPSDGIPF